MERLRFNTRVLRSDPFGVLMLMVLLGAGVPLAAQEAATRQFILSQTLGTIRDDFSGFVGMQILTGPHPERITALGRFVASGNNQSHLLKIVQASDGTDVPGGSVTVSLAGAVAGQYRFGDLAAPVTLEANRAYYIVSGEELGGDAWHDFDTRVTSDPIAQVMSAVFFQMGSGWTTLGGPGQTYGPVNFKFETSEIEKPFVVQVSPGRTRNDVSGFLGMVITVGTQPLTITALGRHRVAGNSGSHVLKVVRMSDGNDVPGTQAAISMAEEDPAGDEPADPFRYATLPAPVTLAAQTVYFVVSEETAGGDSWLDVERTTVVAREVASVDGGVFALPGSAWETGGLPAHSYGPVTFKYLGRPDPIPPEVSLTAPADGAVYDVPATVPLRADASAGVTNVEFYAGGVRIGRDSSTPYGINWVNPAPGNYEIAARALAGNGGISTSAVVNVVVRQPVLGVEAPFILAYEEGALRNDFDGYIGMAITVGNNPLAVSALGRFCFPDSSGRHRLKIVRASDGMDVPGGTAVLVLAGSVPGQFAYVPLGRPVILSPNTEYYVVSEESFDGDPWQDFQTGITPANVASVNQAVYGGAHFPWTRVGGGDRSFGPVNFKYLAEGGPEAPTVAWVQPMAGAAFEEGMDIVLEVAASQGVTNVSFYSGPAALGSVGSRPFSLIWPAPEPGPYSLQAVATDTNGVTVATPLLAVLVGGAPAGDEVTFIQAVAPGLTRNDFNGFLGIEFTVGPRPLTLTRLGRLMIEGNTQTHVLKVVHAASGQDVPHAQATVIMTGGEPGQFIYAPLFFPITLDSGTHYFLVSEEFDGGDHWFDIERTSMTGSAVASLDGGVFGGPPWQVGGLPGHAYVGLDFMHLAGPSVRLVAPGDEAVILSPTNLLIEATASHQIGTVEFYQGSSLIGTATAIPFAATWTNPPPGDFELLAVGRTPAGESATSSVVRVSVRTRFPGSERDFVISAAPQLPRNDFSGFLGMEFTVGAAPIIVTALGRIIAPGNAHEHLLKLIDGVSGEDLGLVNVPTAGGVPGQFVYRDLAPPIRLKAQSSYFLVSEEQEGADSWYDVSRTTVTNSAVAVVDGGVFGGPPWASGGLPGHTYGPVSFRYLDEFGSRLAADRVGGQFRLWLYGQPGRSYRVEASGDLKVWEEVGVYAVEANPTMVADPQAGVPAARFYRAVELPP